MEGSLCAKTSHGVHWNKHASSIFSCWRVAKIHIYDRILYKQPTNRTTETDMCVSVLYVSESERTRDYPGTIRSMDPGSKLDLYGL